MIQGSSPGDRLTGDVSPGRGTTFSVGCALAQAPGRCNADSRGQEVIHRDGDGAPAPPLGRGEPITAQPESVWLILIAVVLRFTFFFPARGEAGPPIAQGRARRI